MMETTFALVEHRVRAIAAEYVKKGYVVVREPSPSQLPDFLSGYRPDLLASNASEWVVVVVKPRTFLSKEPQIGELARLLQSMPDWRLELALVDIGDYLDVPDNSRHFTREEIRRTVAEAERLLVAEFAEAALLQAWAAAEATVRLLTEEEGWQPDRPTSQAVVNHATHLGAICGDEYSFLHDALRQRNAYAHGMAPPEFDSSLVDALIDLTKRLLDRPPDWGA